MNVGYGLVGVTADNDYFKIMRLLSHYLLLISYRESRYLYISSNFVKNNTTVKLSS